MDTIDIKKAIGENADKDYLLDLEEHQRRYQSALPQLVALLKRSDIEHIVAEYHTYDQDALFFQQKYRTYSQRLRWVIFLGVIASTLMITAGTLPNHQYFAEIASEWPAYLLRFSAIATIICSAIGTIYLQLIKGQRYLEKWMTNRAMAEEERIAFFEALVKYTPTDDVFLQLVVLEYFRRYQLDKQIAYYKYRAQQYAQQYSRVAILLAILAGGVVIVNGVTGVIGIEISFLASVSLIFQGYSALVSNQESSEQYQRNSMRYEKLGRQLTSIRSRMDQTREAIRKGRGDVLAAFVKAVHTPMAAEHQQWLETMSGTNEALEVLEQQLNQIGES